MESRTGATLNHDYVRIEQVLIELVTQVEFMSEVQCDLSICVSQSECVFSQLSRGKTHHIRRNRQEAQETFRTKKAAVCGCVYAILWLFFCVCA